MTRYALNAINKKDEAWKKYRKKRSARNWDFYCNARNISVEKVRQAKRNFEISFASEVGQGNTSAFYAYARSKTTIKEKVSRVTKTDGTLTETKKDTADTINLTFQSVFVNEGDEPLPDFETRYDGPLLEDIQFTTDTVKNLLENLEESSAPGPREIHPKVLSECADQLSSPLYLIYRQSLDEGLLPSDWKKQNSSQSSRKVKK